MTRCFRAAVPAAALLALAAIPAAAAPAVAVDIPPVHSIVARVMQGAGTPGLVIPPGASPHGYAMRPSEARTLQDAEVVFWTGAGLTPWLTDTLDALAPDAQVVELTRSDGITLLPFREAGAFAEPERHEDSDHDDADHDHDHHGPDPHLWLDPANGVAIAAAAAAALAAADPDNAALYAANAAAFGTEMAALDDEVAAQLAPIAQRPFMVFHDAYQYFETRFAIPAAGSVALGDADLPGAARVAAIRDRMRDAGVVCVFAEPQFEPALIATVIEGTPARTGILDPLGAELAPGPGLYPRLLRDLAASLADCLGAGG